MYFLFLNAKFFFFFLTLVFFNVSVADIAVTTPNNPPTASAPTTFHRALQEARELAKRKQRISAAKKILVLLETESGLSGSAKGFKEALEHLEILTSQFFSEEAIKQYEMGEALIYSDPKEAITNLRLALRSEASNTVILAALSRAYYRRQNCPLALQYSARAFDLNPYSPEIIYVRARAMECSYGTKTAMNFLASLKTKAMERMSKSESLPLKVLNLEFEMALGEERVSSRDGGFQKDFESLIKADPQYPEIYFFRWMLTVENDASEKQVWAKKYLDKCQDRSLRLLRKYKMDTKLCSRVDLVRVDLASQENEGI